MPVPMPVLGEGDRDVVWVEAGWLQARRETARGVADWHVVLARATGPKPPDVSAPKGTTRFEVSYGEGHYLVGVPGPPTRRFPRPGGPARNG